MIKTIKHKMGKVAAILGLFLLAFVGTVSAAVPAAVDEAITDVTTVGASVFTAMLAIGIPILAWKLVKRVRGA